MSVREELFTPIIEDEKVGIATLSENESAIIKGSGVIVVDMICIGVL